MNITFANKKLEMLANNDRKMQKELGQVRAKVLRRRLAQLDDATTLEDVRDLPGNYHELRNDRKGQWACDLDQPYRLIFEPHEDPIPTNEDGQYVWLEIVGVEVIEIINYHKEK
ncbi:type II toxin-antitoxin system RelE/ParE family toxin [Salibacter halophilus]|uniref:Killer suppression protein HigA n=1 Tax=Salibacter halophilus TaxID=1803916 RepID=A0A6N6M5Z6_9FLAO|nr:type II toxin-antitoxin system RelE/ParE family toxin [Salibacter halophilus]KAB1065133.1 killer suppression protein HigA [Salibacter halophilus]